MKSNLILMPYQKEAVHHISKFDGRSLLALEMGLGKTIISLEWLRQNSQRLPALVLCPASVKYNWEHEALKWFGFHTSICNGQLPPDSVQRWSFHSPLTIINYDVLRFWKEHLKTRGFKTIIIDECHYCANPHAKRTRATKEIARSIPNIIALSGTPLINRPVELFPILNMLWPSEFNSFWRFAQRYCGPKLTPWGWDYKGASHLDELRSRLDELGMLRFKKENVIDLPEKVRRIVPCELSNKSDYQLATTDFVRWLKQNAIDKLRSALRAESLVKIGYLLRLCAKLKLKSAVDWIERYLEETDEKIVIFAVHRKCIQALERRIKEKSVVIDGSVSGRERQKRIIQFQTDKKTRVLIGNIRAAGVGINLTEASTVIFVELGWRPGDLTQAEDRCHRIGQGRTTWIYYLIAGDTIEESLCKLLQKKQETVTTVLDGKSSHDLDLYHELLKVMKGMISNGKARTEK